MKVATKFIKKINKMIKKDLSLVVSFDVIFHLVEDNIYKRHLKLINCIDASYCLITPSDQNIDYDLLKLHVKHRKYSDYLKALGWIMVDSKIISNDRDRREIKLFEKTALISLIKI